MLMLPLHPDEETLTLQRMLERGQWLPHEREPIKRQLYDRKAWVEAGVLYPGAEHWSRKLRAELDPWLRLRFDFYQGWMLERFHSECWRIVGCLGFKRIQPDFVDFLRSRDMQAVGANEYLRRKRADADKVRESNEKKSTEKVMAAVDSLSSRQISQFVAVERARHTGEKIIHHGEDLKFMEHVEEKQKTEPAPPAEMGQYCANPGMNPKLYRRKSGGKHIKE